jgi:hypothetical protein
VVLAGCGAQPPQQQADTPTLEQRLSDLERRMEILEARPGIAPPYRSKAEIEAHIEALEAERGQLLTRYLPQHPAIRDIDRMLQILDFQLQLLDKQGGETSP